MSPENLKTEGNLTEDPLRKLEGAEEVEDAKRLIGEYRRVLLLDPYLQTAISSDPDLPDAHMRRLPDGRMSYEMHSRKIVVTNNDSPSGQSLRVEKFTESSHEVVSLGFWESYIDNKRSIKKKKEPRKKTVGYVGYFAGKYGNKEDVRHTQQAVSLVEKSIASY